MSEQPTIVVRGEALREVPPEQAVFSVTVSARDRDRETVVNRLLERAAEMKEILAGQKSESSGVQVFPELKRGSERVVAYSGSVGTTVTVTDFETLGPLMLRLAGLEFATVSGPWWQLRPGSRAGAEVRREAIADALARAREYAAAVGAHVDRLVEIADEGLGGGGPVMMRAAAMSFDTAAESGAGFELDPQQQTVQASVTVRVTITEPDLSAGPSKT
ncbi:SIMPL domain-containing protein [Actinoplanes sp. NPDC049596]|uniref:SIMPL domain-containing protein n=1 Tax=unclassified Actinoplanes TaxID=2626549 RepID=UPI003430A3F8